MNLKQIDQAFKALSRAFYCANRNHAEDLHAMCKAEERDHRGWGPDFYRYHSSAPSVSMVGKLFAVKRVAEYLNGEKEPSGSHYLHIQKSCFLASAMVCEFGDDIRKAWTEYDIPAMAKLSYTDFVKVTA